MADDQPAAAAAAVSAAASSAVAVPNAANTPSSICIKCRYCKRVLKQGNKIVSCDLCTTVCCDDCWAGRGRLCGNSGGSRGVPCHADETYDPWQFKIGEELNMDLAHGSVLAARGKEDRAFQWLQMQFQGIRHGIALQLAATTDEELRRRRSDEIQKMINVLGSIKGKAKRMGDGVHRTADDEG